MMSTYQLASTAGIIRLSDNASIPADPANRDYAEYLAWVAAGNTPDPYVAPAPPPVTQVAPVQGRIALLNAGLLAPAQAAVNAAGGATAIWWEYATVWERDNPLLQSLAGALGLTPQAVDLLFKQAAAIK